MRGERPDHTLQTTALVHEAYLRLIDTRRVHWRDRAHFFAMASRVMRRVLVDAARARLSAKRGGGLIAESMDAVNPAAPAADVEIVALEEALTALATIDPRPSRVVELRFFGGFSVQETADALGVSVRTVINDWNAARAWLYRRLTMAGAIDEH
jgi:RNA polymerase sigma factor (TIGR02999 family)